MLIQQYSFEGMILAGIFLALILWIAFVILIIVYQYQKRKARQPFQRPEPLETFSEIFDTLRISSTPAPPGPDMSSSPVGGSCLECESLVTEETSTRCPDCGVKRKRCVICQRFVAGGQELLTCPFCHSLSHANEIIVWVQKKNKCPYCGRRLQQHELVSPETLL